MDEVSSSYMTGLCRESVCGYLCNGALAYRVREPRAGKAHNVFKNALLLR